MIHQTLRLGKCWKLFRATLNTSVILPTTILIHVLHLLRKYDRAYREINDLLTEQAKQTKGTLLITAEIMHKRSL